jgi:carbonic anhydrase
MDSSPFADLLAANRSYASEFSQKFDAVARAGVAVVTCMDSRIEPLRMIGLDLGDAKIFRNPGGRVTESAMEALVLAVHLLGVYRILVVPHSKCAMASYSEAELHTKIGESVGQDVTWHPFHVISNQEQTLGSDVQKIVAHPLIPDQVVVGGFLYDVDTGALKQLC